MSEKTLSTLPSVVTGSATITAKAGKPATVVIVAYTGGMMQPPGFPPLVVNTAGVLFGERITLLADHDNKTGSVVGYGVPEVSDGRLIVRGELSEATEAGRQIIQLHREGVRWEASIGLQPSGDFYDLRKGETVLINGRVIEAGPGGLRVYSGGELLEVSIVPQGADRGGTAVSISAAKQRNGVNMQSEAYTIESDSPAAILAAYDRIDSWSDVLSGEATRRLKAAAKSGELLGDRLDAELAREAKAALADAKSEAELRAYRAAAPAAPSPQWRSAPNVSPEEQLGALIATRALGESMAAKAFSPAAMEAANDLRRYNTIDACLAVNGITSVSTPDEKFRAAMTPTLQASGYATISLPIALGNTMNKVLDRIYREAPAVWRRICKISGASNFHPQTNLRPTAFGSLDKVGPQGEVKSDRLGNETATEWKLQSYSKNLQVAFQHLRNDDLGFIEEVVMSQGPAAMRTVANEVFTMLNAAGNFYTTGKGNLITSNAFSVEGLAKALLEYRTQKDDRGNYIDQQPVTLLCGPSLEQAAKELLMSEFTERVATASNIDKVRPTGNPLRDSLRLEIEPRLGDTSTTWYLFSAPEANPITVGFLDGRAAPTVEYFDLSHSPDTLGVSWRVSLHFGTAMGDFRASQKNTA